MSHLKKIFTFLSFNESNEFVKLCYNRIPPFSHSVNQLSQWTFQFEHDSLFHSFAESLGSMNLSLITRITSHLMNQMSQWIFQFEQDSLFHSVNQLIQWIKIIEGTINFIYPSVGEFTRSSSSQVERVRNNYLTRFTSFSFNESVESVNPSVITESHLCLIQWISWVSDFCVTPVTEIYSTVFQETKGICESFHYNRETLFSNSVNRLIQWIFQL